MAAPCSAAGLCRVTPQAAEFLVMRRDRNLRAFWLASSLLVLCATVRADDASPIDLAAKTLPGSYAGMNVEELIAGYKALRTGPKGEFETTANYQKRLKEELAKPILGALTVDSLMDFSFGVPPVAVSYDADAGELSFQALAKTSKVVAETFYLAAGPSRKFCNFYSGSNTCDVIFMTRESTLNLGEYVGQNAYGVQKTIAKRRIEIAGVRVCVGPVTSGCGRIDPKALSVRLAPDVAKEAKQSPRILVIGKLAKPYVTYKSDTRRPTIDLPVDEETAASYATLEPAQ